MSDVPADFAGAFAEQDGKAVFVGGEFDFRTAGDVEAMKRAKDNANSELSDVKSRLKSFEGIDPVAHKNMLDEIDVLKAQAKDSMDEDAIKAIVDARTARNTESLTAENKSLTAELEELKGFKLKTEKQSLIGEALKSVSKDARMDAEAIVGMVMERQADGTYMSNGALGFDKGLSAEQVVAKAMESRPHWKKQNTPGHGGTGSSGSGVKGSQSEFQALLAKNKEGKLTRQEQQRLSTLATEMKQT